MDQGGSQASVVLLQRPGVELKCPVGDCCGACGRLCVFGTSPSTAVPRLCSSLRVLDLLQVHQLTRWLYRVQEGRGVILETCKQKVFRRELPLWQCYTKSALINCLALCWWVRQGKPCVHEVLSAQQVVPD